MRVGMIGTGAISHKHAQAYKNIGFQLTVCTDIFEAAGRRFADQYGAEFVPTYEEVCRHPKVDYVDVCTFPDFRMQPILVCAESGKHVQVQKPISTNLETARLMVETARQAGILLGVVSQHRFDDSSLFLAKAIAGGRLGTKGTAIISGDKLTTWDVENDSGEPAPVASAVASGASDPMAISLEPFERQFLDFGDAIAKGRKPMVAGEEGVQAMEIVDAIYRSCRTGERVTL